ncbi:hypothetical protein COCCADRAFT_1071 [Bipolaris zeicola 26-R-13]|uniref:Uncharacterized protein n=1 Tax=Cochliobolus carbonum (strain 26-R-13) TaxID=930089 RepID=W6YK70_COCC2|nr:uncharacterized protein COCCADRAFT_1071 [Bipolaris zeicola 26-R-13]EUC38030.1 hypothetical protein COCCADRAFT_1071 [Bipolaris zeicola 26-R-13]
MAATAGLDLDLDLDLDLIPHPTHPVPVVRNAILSAPPWPPAPATNRVSLFAFSRADSVLRSRPQAHWQVPELYFPPVMGILMDLAVRLVPQ